MPAWRPARMDPSSRTESRRGRHGEGSIACPRVMILAADKAGAERGPLHVIALLGAVEVEAVTESCHSTRRSEVPDVG